MGECLSWLELLIASAILWCSGSALVGPSCRLGCLDPGLSMVGLGILVPLFVVIGLLKEKVLMAEEEEIKGTSGYS